MSRNSVGMHKQELTTPALLVDLDAVERNLNKMASYFAASPINLRPHIKTHKVVELAEMQIAAGAKGICCGNLDEAAGMIGAGILDVLVTKEIVSSDQIERVAGLARYSQIMVVVDDERVINAMARAAMAAGTKIGALVDVDVRLGRSGVPPGEPVRSLALKVHESRGLEFKGLMGYEGSMHDLGLDERERQCKIALQKLVESKELIERDGIPVHILSAGSTNTYAVAAAFPGVTEVQPGSYLTPDARYKQSEFKPAISVLTTVISRPNATRVTTDAGQKNLSEDHGLPEPKDTDGLRMVALNEEHGILESPPTKEICVGEKLEIGPFHGGTTINLYAKMHGMRGDRVEVIWDILTRAN